jgi:hypothetical protein
MKEYAPWSLLDAVSYLNSLHLHERIDVLE